MKWTVNVPEVHYSIRKVEAETEEEAIAAALADNLLDTEVGHEYSHVLEEFTTAEVVSE
jgi:hypothetical protein